MKKFNSNTSTPTQHENVNSRNSPASVQKLRKRLNSEPPVSVSPFSSPVNSGNESDIIPDPKVKEKKNRQTKKNCPCGGSSQGLSWLLSCNTCKQSWHTTCVNLKADNIPKTVIDSILKHWNCPWCWVCPIPPPPKHPSSHLQSTALSDTICHNISSYIDEKMTDLSQSRPEPLLDSIKDQLATLTDAVKNLTSQNFMDPAENLYEIQETAKLDLQCAEKPVGDYRADYLPEDESQETLKFLKTSLLNNTFKKKRGHSVIIYGEEYKYSGSAVKPTSKTIPPVLQNLVDKVKNDYNLTADETPNSVLVNFFPAKKDAKSGISQLPPHSDDEIEISPESNIFTYTLGAERQLSFVGIHDPDFTDSITPCNNSLYVMSRSSQAWFQHSILDVSNCEERYSVTLRRVDDKNKRSVIIIGDSNSKDIKFGSGRGTLGETYPGRRVSAPKVENIDPAKCIGYENVVIVCGTNNLRPENIKNQSDIVKCFETLKSKVEQIRILCDTKIFVMPILPTRDKIMNQYVNCFNSMIRSGIVEASLASDVWMPPLYEFVDRQYLLDYKLTRDGDRYHLGTLGMCKFVRAIKDAIYFRESEARRSVSQQRSSGTRMFRPGSRKPG